MQVTIKERLPMAQDVDRVSPILPIVTTILWLAVLLALSMVAMFSLMIFDQGVEETPAGMTLMFWGIWATLILCAVSILGGWLTWLATRSRRGGDASIVRGVLYALPLVGVGLVALGAVL